MKALVQSIEATFETFQKNAAINAEKGNKAAGVRARKAALELMKNLKEFRRLSTENDKK